MQPDENVARTFWAYDERGWLSTACRYAADGTLTYDEQGHSQVQPSGASNVTNYRYDEEARLVKE